MHPGLKSEKTGDVQKLYRNCCCGRDVQEVRIHKEEAIRLNIIILLFFLFFFINYTHLHDLPYRVNYMMNIHINDIRL